MKPSGKEILTQLINKEQLYQHAPCGYLVMLPDSSIIDVNDTLVGWLGFTKEEMCEKNFADLLGKGGKIHYEMFFLPMIKVNGGVKELSYELVRKDGSFFAAMLNGTVIKESGRILGFNISVTDITQRKQFETQLIAARKNAESEKKSFQLLANVSPEMIWTSDEEGKIGYINPRFSSYFNLSLEDVDARTLLLNIYEPDRKKLLRKWMNSVHNESQLELKCRIRNSKRNDYEWFSIKVTPSKNNTDGSFKLIGWAANINESVKAMERKDEFIHIASHELNTPVTVLKACLQILENSELSDKLQGLVKKGLKSIKNLQFLISSLLDVSVINSGTLSLHVSIFSLTDMVKDCIDQLSTSKLNHEILLNPVNGDYIVKGDKDRLAQVIINLVNNAAKYSPGKKKIVVQLSKNKEGDMVTVEVTDFGIGIAEDELHAIFEKYYRVPESAAHTDITGLGLGLYITNNIIHAHKSKLLVKSEVGKGSTFYFSLPIQKVEPQ